MEIHNPNSYDNLNVYNQNRVEESFFDPSAFQTTKDSNISQWQANELTKQQIEEQRLMRKAYCKANNIPYEEPQEIPGMSQGSLKVLVIIVWLFIVGTVLSSLIGEGNFLTNFMKVWF